MKLQVDNYYFRALEMLCAFPALRQEANELYNPFHAVPRLTKREKTWECSKVIKFQLNLQLWEIQQGHLGQIGNSTQCERGSLKPFEPTTYIWYIIQLRVYFMSKKSQAYFSTPPVTYYKPKLVPSILHVCQVRGQTGDLIANLLNGILQNLQIPLV